MVRLYSDDGQKVKEFAFWNNSIYEALSRMKDHLFADTPIKFDARDRAALAFIVDYVENVEREVTSFTF